MEVVIYIKHFAWHTMQDR